ncbi:MAG: carbon starvation protein A, partial [Verrucomicrobiota bacterium]|nr:carbon starvation protein A [Verrucomicrobiota bacterium]
ARYLWTTLLPLSFMILVTFWSGWLKIFSSDPRIGFLSGAALLDERLAAAATNVDFARQALIWRIDALVALSFLVLVFLIVAGSAWQWWRLLRGTKPIVLHESEFVSLAQLPVANR